MRLLWEIHAKVRSTTHLRGKTRKPLGAINLCQSTSLPSLAHSCAQSLATSSGSGFRGLRTTSTLKPNASSAHLQPILVGHLGAVYLGLEHQPLRVHQQVALSAFHLLGGVEAALFASHSRSLDRLGVHNACARVRVPAKVPPQPPAQLSVQALPRPIDTPPPEPVVDGLPRREVPRQQPPRAGAFQDVEDGV